MKSVERSNDSNPLLYAFNSSCVLRQLRMNFNPSCMEEKIILILIESKEMLGSGSGLQGALAIHSSTTASVAEKLVHGTEQTLTLLAPNTHQ